MRGRQRLRQAVIAREWRSIRGWSMLRRVTAGGVAIAIVTAVATPVAQATHGRDDVVPAAQRARVVRSVERSRELRSVLDGYRKCRHLRADVHRSPNGTNWAIDYYDGDRIVIEAGVSGSTGALLFANGTRYDCHPAGQDGGTSFGGKVLANAVVWWALAAAFAILLIDPRRPGRWGSVDVVALLSLGVSHTLYVHRHLEASMVAAYPTLAYLAIRLSIRALKGASRSRSEGAPSIVASIRPSLLWPIAVLALSIRAAVFVSQARFSDIGAAGVLGAERLLQGQLPYGHSVGNLAPIDVYGPATYVAYLPGVLLSRGVDRLTQLSPRHELMVALLPTTLMFDLACVVLLAAAAHRWSTPIAAPVSVLAWALLPETTFALFANFNDQLVAALLLVSIVLVTRPVWRGAAVGVAVAAKFVPLLAIGPLIHASGRRGVLRTIAGVIVAIVGGVVVIAARPDGFRRFWDAVVGFQLHREERLSELHARDLPTMWETAHLSLLQHGLQVAVLAFVVLLAVRPRPRSGPELAAAVAAVMFAVQLVAPHWWYNYLLWGIAPLLVVIVVDRFGYVDRNGTASDE